ncbi:hypothetical protein XELAEV_18047674mg [Xenopus laevis]|uniref:Amidohydrolase-related domain-containing protein n=1 Tax=Xenopus laevis TaxID=8355 RepID=A0A974BVP2_XENLA|nr:hypothetical protein XELAEV_18047674mg [Xenopus laevis]
MPSYKSVSDAPIVQFRNCRILRDHTLLSREKKGAHPEHCLRSFSESVSFSRYIWDVGECQHHWLLRWRGSQAEDAVTRRASFITHLFNAILPFHHRDPGIVGLLTSDQIPKEKTVYYGMIADGIHTSPAALRIAHHAHPTGLVLVTDTITDMGLGPGKHTLGQQEILIERLNAYVAELCMCLFVGCTLEKALEADSLHPAQVLGIQDHKGTLDFGADADFVLLDDCLNVKATYISGKLVWKPSAWN